MKRPRVTPIDLSEEQEQFFIETWKNNPSSLATIILSEKLGIGMDAVASVAKQLRETGKVRNKKHVRYSTQDASAIKDSFEKGMTLREIGEAHGFGIKVVRKCLKDIYGDNLPKIKPTLDGEIWKDIEGCSSHQVSNMGRIYVKSINMIVFGFLAHGYRHVKIKDDDGNNHIYAIHRLVAQAFVPNPDNKPQVDHIDSNPENNKANNLRWVTQEEQLNNEESIKKKQRGREQQQRRWKIQPLIKKMLEIEPDKLELVKMIINYKS